MGVTSPDGLETQPDTASPRWVGPRPEFGLWVLVLAAAFPVRFSAGNGVTASIFDVVVLTLCLTQLAFVGATRRDFSFLPRPFVLLFLAAVLASLLSLLWSSSPRDSLLFAVSWGEASIASAFVVAALGHQNPRVVIRWMATFGLLLLVAPLLMYFGISGFQPPAEIARNTGDYVSYFTRFSHPFIGRSNNIATLLALLLIPLGYWALTFRRYRFTALAIGAALLGTLSRGVLIGVAIAAVILVIGSGTARKVLVRKFVIAALLAAIPLAVAVTQSKTLAGYLGQRTSSTNVSIRQGLLETGWLTVSNHPFLGVGAGIGADVHNTYLQQIIYFGVFLGSAIIVLLVAAPRWFFHKGELPRAVGLGVVAVSISLLFESSLEGNLLRPLIFLCIGLGIALTRSAGDAKGTESTTAPLDTVPSLDHHWPPSSTGRV